MNTQTERMPVSVYLLSLCNAYLFVGASLLITVSALIGFELAEDKRLSTLPLALQFFSVMCTSVPASMIMGKYGRKAGFFLASGIGIAGALIAIWSITNTNFYGFCVATICFGVFAGFGNYYRFTAAEVVGPMKKSLAISLVMAGGVIAAFIGPNLANWSSNMFSSYQFAGPFVVLLGVYVLSVFTIAFADLPKKQNAQDNQGGRPVAQLIMQPVFLVAVICQMLGYGTMNFVMSSTPLAMNVHNYGMSDTALVIQWHVAAMFAPSFITGHLIRMIGNVPVLFLGAILGLISIAINLLAPISVSNFVIALITLGVSWNFLYVGGTTLLTDAYEPNEKSRAQGANDLAVFSMVTVTALSTGTVHHLYGWETVNIVALPMLFVTLAAIIWLWVKQRSDHSA
jgi:predicted MFS family arabinose efflux permease